MIDTSSLSFATILRMSEDEARAWLEAARWPNGPVCPFCGSVNVGRIAANPDKKVRAGLLKCRAKECRKQFTVTVGTILHGVRVPMRTWLLAFSKVCSSKKGISALQLQRELSEMGALGDEGAMAYQTAWHMAHRIRYAMHQGPLVEMLKGTVEVDETYVGGKPRRGDPPGKRGRGTDKQPVVALVSREGNARTFVPANVKGASLKAAIRESVDREARICTDQFNAYPGIGAEFAGGHEVVQHNIGEYARGDVYTNTVECFFSLLKRAHMGTHHKMSKQHLWRYCDERAFMWNTRKMKDGPRTALAFKGIEGRRLTLRPVKGADRAAMPDGAVVALMRKA